MPQFLKDAEGRLRAVLEKPKDDIERIVYAPNFCDPCCWYQGSSGVVNEQLDDSGDGLTFNSDHTYWIDLNHGRLCKEDRLAEHDDYNVVIKVDGVTKTERAPFATSGGDYSINYEAGTVTFFQAQTGVVTADYHHANLTAEGSVFTFAPTAGMKLWLVRTEVQFSVDAVMNDTFMYQAFAYDPTPPHVPKIPAEAAHKYKRMRDLLDESNGSYPVVPALGGSARGIPDTAHVFPFDYAVLRELRSDLGVEIRVWLENGQKFDGQFCTVTFYCSEHTLDDGL